MNKITASFMKDQNGYLNGIAAPVEDSSFIVKIYVYLECEGSS